MIYNDLVSVIIPMYNAENFIEECVSKLLKQTYDDIEIILINDGSTDNTFNISKDLENRYRKVHVYNQENFGVSHARNVGIENSHGKWIVFLDVDDYMEENGIELAINLAVENEVDTVCWNCFGFDLKKVFKFSPILPNKKVLSGHEMKTKLVENLYGTREKNENYGFMFRAVWGKLLSSKIIKDNNLFFPVGLKLGEDAAFLTDYFIKCNKVLFINKYLNYYRLSELSTVGKYKEDILEIQQLEFNILKSKFLNNYIDINTVMLNMIFQYDCQFVHNLYKTKSKFISKYFMLKSYIEKREVIIKKREEYNLNKTPRKSRIIVLAIIYNQRTIEALLCLLREEMKLIKRNFKNFFIERRY